MFFRHYHGQSVHIVRGFGLRGAISGWFAGLIASVSSFSAKARNIGSVLSDWDTNRSTGDIILVAIDHLVMIIQVLILPAISWLARMAPWLSWWRLGEKRLVAPAGSAKAGRHGLPFEVALPRKPAGSAPSSSTKCFEDSKKHFWLFSDLSSPK